MKTRCKRIISLLLALVMLVGILGVSAFADHDVNQYEVYTVLGDSIPSGYGTDAYYAMLPEGVHVRDGNLVSGTYDDIVAKAVGAQTVNVCSHCGWRTTEFLYEIGYPGYTEPTNAYSPYYSSSFFRKALDFLPASELDGEGERIRSSIETADLITVNFGTNDIYSFALTTAVTKFSILYDKSGVLDIHGLGDLMEVFGNLLANANEMEYRSIIAEFVSAMETGFATFRSNWPLVIDAIRQLNPDADIVAVGVTSPVTIALDLFDKIHLDPYTLNDLLIDRVNYFLRTCDCADEYTFVDVVGTEFYGVGALDTELLLAGDEDVKFSAIKMVHPTEAGHVFMADRILLAMHSSTVVPEASARYSSIIKRNTINWKPVDGAVKYYVYRSLSANGPYVFIGVSDKDIYYDYLTVFGVTYYYKVCAVMNREGTVRTPYSEPVSIKAR